MADDKPLISKNILYAGEGDTPEFEPGSKVKLSVLFIICEAKNWNGNLS